MATKIENNINRMLQVRILQIGSAFSAQVASFPYFFVQRFQPGVFGALDVLKSSENF